MQAITPNMVPKLAIIPSKYDPRPSINGMNERPAMINPILKTHDKGETVMRLNSETK